MIISGVLEWVLGNSFPSVVFLTFGAFWLTFAGTLTPGFAAYASFAAEGADASTGLQSQAFNASFGKPSPRHLNRALVPVSRRQTSIG